MSQPTITTLDLGFCPRCKDIIQPQHSDGYRSLAVDGVLFCVFCACRVEWDSAERAHWVEWAK